MKIEDLKQLMQRYAELNKRYAGEHPEQAQIRMRIAQKGLIVSCDENGGAMLRLKSEITAPGKRGKQ